MKQILGVLLLLFCVNAHAITHYSTDGMNWSAFSLSQGDTVRIQSGHTVYVTGNQSTSLSVIVYVDGILELGNPGFLSLGSGSAILINNRVRVDNSNNNDKIRIGSRTWDESTLAHMGPGNILMEDDVPVVLVYCKGRRIGANVRIDWRTSLELNNSHFIIECSNDGITWDQIGIVYGSGTTKQPTDYYFIYNNPNKSYYRIFQVDYDNSIVQLSVLLISGYVILNVKYYDLQGREVDTNYSGPKITIIETKE